MRVEHITTTENWDRLDRFLSHHFTDKSRTYLQKLIADGCVMVDGQPARASARLQPGSTISITWPEIVSMDIQAEDIPLDIIYEDEWLVVVNKPQGMVVHPAAGHHEGTLVHALLHHCAGQLSDLNGVIRPGIIHRIDKDTSGLLLAVKDNQVHRHMAEQIRSHSVERIYQAVVHGFVDSEEGTIEAPVGRDPRHRQRMAVVGSGKPAVTHFRVLERFEKATFVEAKLQTGRTHQIRVHFRYVGHPLVGDPVYAPGRKNWGLKGQALHAGQLSFQHPVLDRPMTFTAPRPDYFDELLEKMRSGY